MEIPLLGVHAVEELKIQKKILYIFCEYKEVFELRFFPHPSNLHSIFHSPIVCHVDFYCLVFNDPVLVMAYVSHKLLFSF